MESVETMETTQMRTRKDYLELITVRESAATMRVSQKLEGRQTRGKDEYQKLREGASMPFCEGVGIGDARGLTAES